MNIEEYLKKEVFPQVPDAFVDYQKTKIGYRINIKKYFYKFTPLRSLSEIEADLRGLQKETEGMLEDILS